MHLLQKGGIQESDAIVGQEGHPINIDDDSDGPSKKSLKATNGKVVSLKRSSSMDTFADQAMTSAETDKAHQYLLRYDISFSFFLKLC